MTMEERQSLLASVQPPPPFRSLSLINTDTPIADNNITSGSTNISENPTIQRSEPVIIPSYGAIPTDKGSGARTNYDLIAEEEAGQSAFPLGPGGMGMGTASTMPLVGTVGEGGEGKKREKTFGEIWPLFLGLSAASFSSAVGATLVANLQIEIGSAFHAGSLASWLGTAFVLGAAPITPLYGRLAQPQILGSKGAMILALVLYICGTVLSAIAPTMYVELLARAMAGAGGGGILTVSAIIITDLVSLADRGIYQGILNLLFGAGAASGVVLGGYIADRSGWRAAFWMQVPPVLLSFVIVVGVDIDHHGRELLAGGAGQGGVWDKLKVIDWAGSGVLTVAISSLAICSSLLSSGDHAPTHPLPAFLGGLGLAMLPTLVWVERRATYPIIPLEMVSRPQVALILVACVLTTASAFSAMFMQPVYLHVARGLTSAETGLLLLPASFAGPLASVYAGWHMKHFNEYKWFQVVISCIAWCQALSVITGWGLDTNQTRLGMEMAGGGLGGGATLTTLMTSIVVCVEPSELSLAISALYLSRAIGQVLGLGLSASIQQTILYSSLLFRFPNDAQQPPQYGDLVRRLIQEPAEVIPLLDHATRLQVREAYLDSIRAVFGFVLLCGVGLTAVCFAVRAKRI